VKGSINARAAHRFGGFGDLAAALALERLGAEIVVCEQSPALNEVDALAQSQPQGPCWRSVCSLTFWSGLSTIFSCMGLAFYFLRT
jgi:hypothetical protein